MAQAYDDLNALLADHPPATDFTPYLLQNPESDSITFKMAPDADYSERLTDHVTLFLLLDTGDVTGCRIKGVRELMKTIPNWIHIDHDGQRLTLALWSCQAQLPDGHLKAGIHRIAQAAESLAFRSI